MGWEFALVPYLEVWSKKKQSKKIKINNSLAMLRWQLENFTFSQLFIVRTHCANRTVEIKIFPFTFNLQAIPILYILQISFISNGVATTNSNWPCISCPFSPFKFKYIILSHYICIDLIYYLPPVNTFCQFIKLFRTLTCTVVAWILRRKKIAHKLWKNRYFSLALSFILTILIFRGGADAME